MNYTAEVTHMCPVAKGAYHGPAPIPEEGKWVQAKQISDISGFTHGIGWCAPQQGACKLTLNVKDGIIEEALVETIGCSGMTHSAAMASEILIGKTLLEGEGHLPRPHHHRHLRADLFGPGLHQVPWPDLAPSSYRRLLPAVFGPPLLAPSSGRAAAQLL